MIAAPFIIAIDHREKLPSAFEGIRGDASDDHAEIATRTHTQHLATGDYSIVGLTDRVTVERKRGEELYFTLGRGRDRFRWEMDRLAELDAAAIVVEATLGDVLKYPPRESRMSAKAVFRTILAWQQKYRVPWLFCDDRRLAEITCYRILSAFYRRESKQ